MTDRRTSRPASLPGAIAITPLDFHLVDYRRPLAGQTFQVGYELSAKEDQDSITGCNLLRFREQTFLATRGGD